MAFKSGFRVLVLLPFIVPAFAANDWDTPCLDGVCQYSLVGSTDASGAASSGTVKIWGSNVAITDITKAAGWEILDCDPSKLAQNIRLVCTGDEVDESGCGHLYQKDTAEGKLVRLPEKCGASAFARVVRAWVPEDQSMPSQLAARFMKRDGKVPTVKALALDTNFAEAATKWGPVHISVQAANVPGADVDGREIPLASQRKRDRRRLTQRAFNELFDGIKGIVDGAVDGVKDAAGKVADKAEDAKDKVEDTAQDAKDKVEDAAKDAKDKVEDTAKDAKDGVKDAAGKVADKAGDVAGKVKEAAGGVKDGVKQAANSTAEGVKDAAGKVKEGVGKAVDSAKNATTVDVNKNFTLPNIDLNKSFNLINTQIDCGPGLLSASVNADVTTQGDAQISLGVVATGTIVPPNIDNFQLVAGMNAKLDGTLDLTADASGTIDLPKIKIFQIGVPGLTFPGILAIGPTFEINAFARADLDVQMDLSVGMTFDISNAQMTFPPKEGANSSGNFQLNDTPLKLSVPPSVAATGSVEAHLVPSLNLGISALNDIVSAKIFLNMDAGATLQLDLNAGPTETATDNTATEDDTTEDDTATSDDTAATEDDTAATEDDTVSEESQLKARAEKENDSASTEESTDSTTSTDTVDSTTSVVSGEERFQTLVGGLIDELKQSLGESSTETGIDNSSASSEDQTAAEGETTDEATEDETATQDDTATEDETTDDTASTEDDTASTEDDTAATEAETTNTFGGCVSAKAALSVNAGAQGTFFNIFNSQTKVPLFNKNFQLFQKCFGDPSQQTTADGTETTTDGTEVATDDSEATTDDTEATTDDTEATTDDTEATTDDTEATSEDDSTVTRRSPKLLLEVKNFEKRQTTTATGKSKGLGLASGLSCFANTFTPLSLVNAQVARSSITPIL